MQKGQKIKTATRKIASDNRSTVRQSISSHFWKSVWRVICWPFLQIAHICRWVWNWVCSIDLVGLLNIALLVAIIVMFSMLIIDILQFRKTQVVVVPAHTIEVTDDKYHEPATRIVKERPATLPIKHDPATRKLTAEPIRVVKTPAPTIKIAQDKSTGIMYGDIIIDNRADSAILKNGARIQGNLYLQNMRKYVLPCDIKIDGNLFLRDLNMLQFCGDFTITGNIYVSPRSSFGPIPRTARLGGRVIL